MARLKRKSNNPAGRPPSVGGDKAAVRVTITLPESLRIEVDAAAAREGIKASEWWRRAAYTELGVAAGLTPRLEPAGVE